MTAVSRKEPPMTEEWLKTFALLWVVAAGLFSAFFAIGWLLVKSHEAFGFLGIVAWAITLVAAFGALMIVSEREEDEPQPPEAGQ